jgi:hypothetical protein
MHKSICLLFFIAFACIAKGQTQFWSDDFESAGPTSGIRTPEENGGVGGPPNTSYFRLTDGTTVSQSVAFTGKQGTFYWAGEDHNAPGTGFTASGAQGAAANSPLNELSITWTNINITNKTGLIFKGLFAANSTNEPWDNIFSCAGGVGTTNTDYIIVQYRINSGTWTDLLRFYTKGNSTGTNFKYLYEDTNNDACGDGTELTNVFGEFVKSIPGTGTTLDLRVNVFSEGSNEEWGVDNFRLFYTSALPISLINFSGTNESAGNRLVWSTASTDNKSRYEIERSMDGVDFKNIGTVTGNSDAGNRQSYSFIDNSMQPGLVYYRLKMIDVNGNYNYSPIIRIQVNEKAIQVNMYPNPLKDQLLIKANFNIPLQSIVQLYDASGKQINATVMRRNDVYICDMKALKKGIYIVTLITGKGIFSQMINKLE